MLFHFLGSVLFLLRQSTNKDGETTPEFGMDIPLSLVSIDRYPGESNFKSMQ